MYGIGSVPGTIMRDNLSDLLSTGDVLSEDLLAQIDHERVLDRPREFSDHLLLPADDRYQYIWSFSFQKFMGRMAQGRIHETLDIQRSADYGMSGTLFITDGTAPGKTLKLSLQKIACFQMGGEPVFQRPTLSGQESGGSFSEGCAYVGSATGENGQTHPISMTMDSGFVRYAIELIDEPDTEKSELFSYNPAETPEFITHLPDGSEEFSRTPPSGDYPYP